MPNSCNVSGGRGLAPASCRALCLILLAIALGLARAPAQAQTSLPADAPLYGSPNGDGFGTLKRGALVRTGSTKSGWTAVVVEGWIVSTRLGTRRGDTLDRTVTGTGPAPLRIADGSQQALQGELATGTTLKRLSERNGWTQVRRAGWVRSSAMQLAPPTPPTPPTPPKPPSRPVDDVRAQRTARPTSLRSGPGGDERAAVRQGAAVETLAREGGWVHVRIDGWVPERDLTLGDSSAEARVSAADLRADPAAYRGKTVRWEVQVIAVQRADVLRRGLAPDEPYLLARGPGDEGAVLYLAIPHALVDQVRALPQLGTVSVTARVRDGRSEPVGAPLLDLISITRSGSRLP